MKSGVALLLSINGGCADTAGFLALQGLFTAHVTGNLVTLCAALVLGTSGVLAKLLALPVFCATIGLARIAGHAMERHPVASRRSLLGMQFALLLGGCVLAVRFGPFRDGDAMPAVVTGMVLVCGMAIQNALHRVHLAGFPSSTAMTGNATQLILDLTDTLWLPSEPAERAALRQRLRRTAEGVCCFAVGCAAAAVLFWLVGNWCFALPPVLVLAAMAAIARIQPDPLPSPARQRHGTA